MGALDSLKPQGGEVEHKGLSAIKPSKQTDINDPNSSSFDPLDEYSVNPPTKDKVITPHDLPNAKEPNKPFYQQGLEPIKEMQKAMIALSKDMASHEAHSVLPHQVDQGVSKGNTLNGSDDFMNFLITAYMANSPENGAGKQFVNTDSKNPERMNTAGKNTNFKAVLQTIQRIGTPGGVGTETQPDGIWGTRTNNGLRQIYALVYALMQVQDKMDIKFHGYSEQDLLQLFTLIPPDIKTVNINEQVVKAKAITENLNKLRAVYDSFRTQVLDKYTAYIIQTEPVVSGKQIDTAQATISPEEDKYKDVQLPFTLDGKKFAIKPSNLLNMQAFKTYLADGATLNALQIDPPKNDADRQVILKNIIDAIKVGK